ncbi:GNAT family N-acetyltransferase [Phreatobacter sp.]|uniref:GNAT family N-acetyltransferase n=1 Tax=Phreatobacter sp. TaxID=1966341 RepID=UPI0022BAC3A6|nr:GNAT family N-acetyltransferase [Phreatobacter sp.]MCZ8313404.1 GNAT family N-acetyltransferase [Phreatobacter sp.]
MLDELIAQGVIRKLFAWESELLAAHFLRLDPDSRRCRFAAGVSDDTVTAYAATALGADAIVHGFFVDDVLRGAAELRLLPDSAGEVAVTVEEDWRLSGVGSALFGRLLLTARNRGVGNLVMTCLPANRGMQRLAARFDGKITFASGDSVAAVTALPATPISLWREMWSDGSAVAAGLIDRQMRLARGGRRRRKPGVEA